MRLYVGWRVFLCCLACALNVVCVCGFWFLELGFDVSVAEVDDCAYVEYCE